MHACVCLRDRERESLQFKILLFQQAHIVNIKLMYAHHYRATTMANVFKSIVRILRVNVPTDLRVRRVK